MSNKFYCIFFKQNIITEYHIFYLYLFLSYKNFTKTLKNDKFQLLKSMQKRKVMFYKKLEAKKRKRYIFSVLDVMFLQISH